jgi:hypothetical protein
LKKCDGDFGACVGMIQGSLSEREETQIGTHRYQGKSYPLYTDDEHNHYIKVNGRIIQVDESATNEGECPMCKCDPCECYTTEGNAFGDAVKKAKDAGEKEFEFQGKTYKVEESIDEGVGTIALGIMLAWAGLKLLKAVAKKVIGNIASNIEIAPDKLKQLTSELGMKVAQETGNGAALVLGSFLKIDLDKKIDSGEIKTVNELEKAMKAYLTANESEVPVVNDLNEGDLFLPHANLPSITEDQLKKDILGNIGNAFNKLLKDAGIKYNPVTAIESGGRIRFESKPLTGNDLGVMKFGFKEVYINTFSGGSMPKIQKGAADEKLMFTPYIWFTINYSYKHGSADTNATGSNGCSLFLPGENSDSIYYDIGSYKFLTASQAAKKSEWK